MALYYNSTNIPPGNHVYINNADCQKVIYNNVEVWKKETQIYPGTPSQLYSGGGSGVQGDFYVGASKTGTGTDNISSYTRYVLVDLTPYKTLKITHSLNALGTWCWAGLLIDTSIKGAYSNLSDSTAGTYKYRNRVAGDNYTDYVYGGGTVSVDISNFTGNHYIYIQTYLQSGFNAINANASISQIIAL